MNQQNQGSGSSNPSNTPTKRKRGRPRKDESTAQPQAENTPVRRDSDHVINSNQTQGTTGDAGDGMLGRVVTGVIEGVFGAGYLLNVRVGDSQTYLKGAVFLPGRYAPVTSDNDVAPHLEMIQRKEFPIPVLNLQPQMQSAIPSSDQGSQQPIEPKLPAPNSQDQVLPTQIHAGISVLLENQSASVVVPMANMPKNDISVSAGGMPKEISEPGHMSQSVSIMSEMESDKIVEQDGTLHKLDTYRQVKDSYADGGAGKDSQPIPEPMNLLPTTENIDKELLTGQQAGSAVLKLNEQIEDEPKNSKVELNMVVSAEPGAMLSDQVHDKPQNSIMSVSAEPEAMPSDQIHDEPKNSIMSVSAEPGVIQSDQIHDEPENSNIELNQFPGSAVLEPMQSEQTHDEPKNSDIELNQMPVSAEPKAMQSDQIHEEPENLNIQINQLPIAAEPESMQSEQIADEHKISNVELNQMPVSADPKAMQSDQIHEEPENLNIEINQMPIAAESESMQSEQIHDELKNSTVELNQVPISAQEAMLSVDKFVDQQDSPKPALETSHPSTLFVD